MKNNYGIGSILELKKKHPCGSYLFKVVRVGVDIKIKCMECGHMVMLPRVELNKKIKRVIEEDKND